MSVGVPNRPAPDGNQRAAEIEARIAESRRELAELYALRGQEVSTADRPAIADFSTGAPSESVQPPSTHSRAKRLIRTGRDVLRHVWRSPTAHHR